MTRRALHAKLRKINSSTRKAAVACLKFSRNALKNRRMVPKSRSRTMPWVTLFRAAMAAPAVTTGTQQIRKRALVTIMSNTRARNRISGFSRPNKLFTRRPPLCYSAPGTPRR